MKYLYWRNLSLWCTFQLPGYPPRYPLNIYAINDKDKSRCMKLGEVELARLRTAAFTGKLLDKEQVKREYHPTYARLVGRYWYFHLRFEKCARDDRYHLLASLRHFGKRLAEDIKKTDVILWREEQKHSRAVNTINNRLSYMKSVFLWAQKEEDDYKVHYNPCEDVEKLPDGNVRTFVLTQEQFEKNYLLFRNGLPYKERPSKHHSFYRIPPNPNFAKFYLALWETLRRPVEVSQYTWEMITTHIIPNPDGTCSDVRVFEVPPKLAKTKQYATVIISDRLWREISGTLHRTGLIFKNSHGERWTDWAWQQKQLRKVFGDKAGVIRDTRRGSITHITEVEGADPKHVKLQSGHKTNSMFDRYRIGEVRNIHKMVNKKEYQGNINVSNA